MYHPSIMELDLQYYFPGTHQVSITSVSTWGKGFLVLLSIWETEENESQWQMLVEIRALEIKNKYHLDKKIKWSCVHGLEDGKYMLGSYGRERQPAVLSLFQKGKLLKTRDFDKGFLSQILSIERTIDDEILLRGEFYVVEKSGSHDDYFPKPWTCKISKDGEDAIGTTQLKNQICFEEAAPSSQNSPGNYFTYSQYNVFKYDASGKLLWDQDTSITGQEKLSHLKALAPYRAIRGDVTVPDGVWAGGERRYDSHEEGNGLSFPTLFRVSTGGTRLNFSKVFEGYPEMQSVKAIIPGSDRSCYGLGETLQVGKGNGLFMLHVALTPQVEVQEVKYINFQGQHARPVIERSPSFTENFLSLKGIFQKEKENGFTVFSNVSRKKRRDNGKIWLILFDR